MYMGFSNTNQMPSSRPNRTGGGFVANRRMFLFYTGPTGTIGATGTAGGPTAARGIGETVDAIIGPTGVAEPGQYGK